MDGKPGKVNKYNVYIAGISYQLLSNETEEYVREIAGYADNAISKIINSNKTLSVSQATVLAMLNFMDMLKKAELQLEDVKYKLSEISDKELKMQTGINSLREENFEMKKEVLRLNELNKQLELEIASLRQQELPAFETMSDYKEDEETVESDEIKDINTCEPDMVQDFLENVQDPFASPDDNDSDDDSEMFHPLKQQSFEDI